MPVFWFTLRVIASAYGLLVLYAAGCLGLECWRARRERWLELDRRERELYQRDVVAVRAYERAQQDTFARHSRILVRPTDREREHHHPLGHRTMSMLLLPEQEWQLWFSVMQESPR